MDHERENSIKQGYNLSSTSSNCLLHGCNGIRIFIFSYFQQKNNWPRHDLNLI